MEMTIAVVLVFFALVCPAALGEKGYVDVPGPTPEPPGGFVQRLADEQPCNGTACVNDTASPADDHKQHLEIIISVSIVSLAIIIAVVVVVAIRRIWRKTPHNRPRRRKVFPHPDEYPDEMSLIDEGDSARQPLVMMDDDARLSTDRSLWDNRPAFRTAPPPNALK
eukprot:TRINITY_DN32585_c0_g1_i1.p1 TRINITY_DN32585_c0_g1~~TRINITY_DN32585_c0_g1_i1.p1  ORF type:complete len:166 (+),score=35.77 TRINITY_DN32585_c0_g1_i1:155-652(+)